MTWNQSRTQDPDTRAKALVFAVTDLTEQAYSSLRAAHDEVTEFGDLDSNAHTLADTAARRELFELLTNISGLAVRTRISLGSLAVPTRGAWLNSAR
jgi:hypothetical protein